VIVEIKSGTNSYCVLEIAFNWLINSVGRLEVLMMSWLESDTFPFLIMFRSTRHAECTLLRLAETLRSFGVSWKAWIILSSNKGSCRIVVAPLIDSL
jgi:hypothetical protein